MTKHDGETEVRGVVVANCHTDGYTGDTYCLGCGEKIADGENTGKDMTKHDGETEVRGVVAANCSTDGYTGDTYCLGCGEKIATGENTGKDYTIHSTTETVTKYAKEPGYTFKGYTGDIYCAACDHLISNGEDIDKLSIADNATVKSANEILAAEEATPGTYEAEQITALEAALEDLYTLAEGDNEEAVLAKIAEIGEMITTIAPIQYVTVTFTVDGAVVDTQTIKSGESATAPAQAAYINEGETHKRFSGWDNDCTNVTESITVAATYIAEAHTWVDGAVTKAATCMETGTQAQSCACGATQEKTLEKDAANHTGNNVTTRENEVAATCTAAGTYEEVVKCECGVEISRVTKMGEHALGHQWSDWTVVTAATCEQDGSEQRVCANDPQHVETRVINKHPHADNDGDGNCDECHHNMDELNGNGGSQSGNHGFRCPLCKQQDAINRSNKTAAVKTIYRIFHAVIHFLCYFLHIPE